MRISRRLKLKCSRARLGLELKPSSGDPRSRPERLYHAARRSVTAATGCRLRATLHLRLRVEAFLITEDRGHGERLVAAHEAHGYVAFARIPVDVDAVPLLGVADVIDTHIVVRAPKEWSLRERLARAKHVSRGRLAVPLREHPMLDANAVARVRIGPARDVAG